MSECVIKLDHIWTRFGQRVIHRDISLSLGRGEILGLAGGSGSGKTTLLRVILSLQQPDEGDVWVLGVPVNRVEADERQRLRNRCGVLFQGGALFSVLTVFENIALPLRELHRLEEPEVLRLVTLKMQQVGLGPEAAQLLPAELSGGMVKRAALARSLALEPELLLLDEPTSGLDPSSGETFVALVRELHRVLGLSVVMITHDLDTMVDLCDRVAVLADSELVALGPVRDVRHVPHPFVQRLFNGVRARRVLGEERTDGR